MNALQMNLEKVRRHIADGNGNPTVYVGTYGKYNNGSLFGAWLDLLSFESYDEFIETCKTLHADEKDPELMFQDFDFCAGIVGADGSEFIEREEFELLQEAFDEDSDNYEKLQAFGMWIGDHRGHSYKEFEEKLWGKFESNADFAEHYAEQCGYEVPEWMQCAVDWDSFWWCTLRFDFSNYNGFYVSDY